MLMQKRENFLSQVSQIQQEADEQNLPKGNQSGLIQLQPTAFLERGLPDGGAQLPDNG